VDIASRANSGQWLVHDRELAPSSEHAWNKERVPGSQKWLLYHRPGVLGGWPAYEDRDRTRAIEWWGIPQDVNAESSIDITHTLELKIHDLSLSLAQHFLFETHCFKLNPSIARISFFLFSLYSMDRYSSPIYEAIFSWLNITKKLFYIFYIEIWQISIFTWSYMHK
jgi:hypothetical protein